MKLSEKITQAVLAGQVRDFADAYQGAMEDVAIWKKRALEAEDLNRKFIAEINGPTYMGEPIQHAPSVLDGWQLVPKRITPHMGHAIDACLDDDGSIQAMWDAALAAPPNPEETK